MSRSVFNNYQIGFGAGGMTHYVRILLLANIAVFAGQLLLDVAFGRFGATPGGPVLVDALAYSNRRLLDGWVWVPFTYMFLHGGLSHLFWNMLQLFFFGPEVERVLGTRQFLRFYIFCGVAGALANLVAMLFVSSGALVLGASGAVLGVLVAFAVTDPDREIILFPIPFPVTIRAVMILLIIMNVLNAMGGGGGVAVATHFGGMIAGYVYMKGRPAVMRWSWERRGRSARRKQASPPKPPAPGTDEDKMAKAIDNIFKFQGKDRH